MRLSWIGLGRLAGNLATLMAEMVARTTLPSMLMTQQP